MDEYLKRVFEAVIQNEELERMSPGMGRLLVEQVSERNIIDCDGKLPWQSEFQFL